MNINKTLGEYFRNNNSISDELNNDEIVEFLDANTPEKYELAQKLIKDLIKPHSKNELYSHIIELYEVENATMKLTGKRDHTIHALNTFLLGLYINDNYLDNKVNMFQWKFAALFHDIAYPIEISQQIIKNYLDKVNTIKSELHIENFNPIFNLVPNNFEKLTNNKNSFEYIQKRVYEWGLDVNVQKRYADMISSNQICHGIISALTVLYLIDLMYQRNNPKRNNSYHAGWEQKNFEIHIVSACSAIYLHNSKVFTNISKNKAVLPYLLKLCDELQNWDRPDKNMPEGDFPENYNISIQNGMLDFKVKDNSIKDEISRNIKCLNDPNIQIILY